MIGYKAFNNDWTCRGFKYEVGKTYRMENTPECCSVGFHFCKKISDCFNYYSLLPKTKVALVESRGAVVTNDDKKFATNVLRIIKEIPWADVLNLLNTGDYNEGRNNTGDHNIGNRNSGSWNSGYWNTGNHNNGSWNTGYWNTGNYNGGDWNTGNCNTGNYNTGNYNSGDWNTGNYNTGCFNTEHREFLMFNKPCSWTYSMWYHSNARFILNQCPIKIEGRQDWYNNLIEEEKIAIKSLPNFNADIFKQVTGISVD